MGQTQPKEVKDNLSAQEKEDIDVLKRLAEGGGPTAVSKHIDEKLNKWKSEKVKLAIAGCSATGKSTFINKIRHVKPGDANFAETGSGNTTKMPKPYTHPRNDNITFTDLPGYASVQFKKETYINEMKISDYDFVFIFFENVRREDDLWLAGELCKMGKPFAFVRSKIDVDINNAIEDGKDLEKILPEIREKNEIDLQSSPELKSTKDIFLISSRNAELGDWSKLMVFLEESIDGFKAQALLFSLHCSTKKILEMKYKMLKKRIFLTTALAAGVAAVPLPGLDVAINTAMLIHEVRHYIRVFGIQPESLQTLENFDLLLLKCRYMFKTNAKMAVLIASKIGFLLTMILATSVLEFVLPLVGSVIFSFIAARVTYTFLKDTLQDVKDDAVLIYEHIMTTNADYRM